jgi:hypothetical protein
MRVKDWSSFARHAMLGVVVGFSTAGHAQTTVNNTVNNTTNIIIQRQQTVILRSTVPVLRTPPPAPREAPPPAFSYQPRELLPYMSPRCAQLYEAQLNGFARRTSASIGAGVRDEFQSDCPDAVNDARQSLNRDKLGKYTSAQDQKVAAKSAAQQDMMTRDQCSELLRILANKRKRIDSMSPGEKEDQARSEERYAGRCKGI